MTKSNDQLELSERDKDFSHWQLPNITLVEEEPKENMFGRMSPKRVSQEIEETILPPTLEEIENIRAEAEIEGREQGHKEGYQEGLEKGRLAGLEQGHNEGFTQGLEQGLQQGLSDAKQQVEQFEKLMQQLVDPLSLVDIEIEQSLVKLTITLAKAVIGHELKTHPEHILSALRQGIDALPLKEQGANVRLHPDDLALVERLYSSVQLEKNRWQLEADPSLQPGECIVSNSRSTVDMGLEHRIDTVFTQLSHTHEQLEQKKAHHLAEQAQKAQQRSTPESTEQAGAEPTLPSTDSALAPSDLAGEDPVSQQEDQHNAESSTAAAE